MWLPKAHVEGDLAMSWILGGIMLKAGMYGIFTLCIVPFCTGTVSPLLSFVCFVGMLFPLVLALTEQHVKRMIAFFSVSHISFAVVLLLQFNFSMALSDCYLIMCGMILGTMHTFISNLLFLLIDLFYRQTKHKYRIFYSAILELPSLSALTFLLMLDNVGALPLTFNFCTEVTAFVTLVNLNNWQLVVVVAIYLLFLMLLLLLSCFVFGEYLNILIKMIILFWYQLGKKGLLIALNLLIELFHSIYLQLYYLLVCMYF